MKRTEVRYIIFAFLLMTGQLVLAQRSCPVIPLPTVYEQGEGSFTVREGSVIVVKDSSLRALAAFLQTSLKQHTGIGLKIGGGNEGAAVILEKNGAAHGTDGYALQMTKNAVVISSPTREGLFYGIVTFLQMAFQSPRKESGLAISCWDIQDSARYAWRGLMLDESRHFFGKETVKMILDWMAFYKLNRFHWHLTDAPGWRLEIKQYPRLASVGGRGNYSDPGAPVQYYTTADIQEIIQYAQERYITVIPEIDMPGHATAANRAYPEFSGGGSEKYPDFTFNPGKAETYRYLTDILREAAELFPSRMIHLGGDEVSFGIEGWKDAAGVQQLMRDESLPGLKAVERYFIQRMTDSALKMYRKVLLWDEAADASLPVNRTIIFWWRHDKPEQLNKALQKGYPVVLCPRLPFYFDFVQNRTHKKGRKRKDWLNSLDKVYGFPDKELSAAMENNLILGLQANLWTELVRSRQHLEYLLFPRIAALSERAWTGSHNSNYQRFLFTLKAHLQLYRKAGIYYYNPFEPAETPELQEW